MKTRPAPVSLENKTIAKIRARLLPFLFVLYVVAFLDRINIGFAALTMNKDLAITSQQFGLLVGIFFFGYFLFEVPSNLILHRVGARVWFARILLSWGAVAVATGFVRNVPQLYAARFLLGVAEAGFFPGIVLYFTYWFPRREQARAIALFMAAQPITSILGAPASGFILDHAHWLGLASWRWLLILEAVPAFVLGLLTYRCLPSRPAEAHFLTPAEKDQLAAALESERAERERHHSISLARSFTNKRVLMMAVIGFAQAIGVYTLNFWMPQEVKSLSVGYSNTFVGLLVAVPYLVALAGMVVISHSSDRRRERKYHAAVPLLVGAGGFLALTFFRSPVAVIVLFSLVGFGTYGFFGPFYSSPGEFLSGASAAAGIALITSISNLGGFAGPYAVGLISRQTGSLYGGFGVAGFALLVSALLLLLLPRRLPLVGRD
ncbi:MAG TPA: MFS transporter [Chthoniobacterales bacterium]|jgi:MFS family permease